MEEKRSNAIKVLIEEPRWGGAEAARGSGVCGEEGGGAPSAAVHTDLMERERKRPHVTGGLEQ